MYSGLLFGTTTHFSQNSSGVSFLQNAFKAVSGMAAESLAAVAFATLEEKSSELKNILIIIY